MFEAGKIFGCKTIACPLAIIRQLMKRKLRDSPASVEGVGTIVVVVTPGNHHVLYVRLKCIV